MQAILAVTVPFFALVLAGYWAAQRRVLPAAAIPGLNAFVLFFALPCMLFRFGQNTPVLELLNPVVLGVYLVSALVIVSFTIAVTRGVAVNLKNAAFGALVAAFPNTGFMGVPLLVALLGPAAAGPVICTVLADLFVTSSVCLAIASLHEASGQGARQAVTQALRGALSNPLPWAIALGALSSATGLRLGGPLEVVVRMLADAATPVALFTIGAVLWRSGHVASAHAPLPPPPGRDPWSEQPWHGPPRWRGVLGVAAIKLALHPLLILVLGLAAVQLHAPISGFQLKVLVLAAALPSASNVSLLAERHRADNGRVARIILATTCIAFVSFALIAWSLGVNPVVAGR